MRVECGTPDVPRLFPAEVLMIGPVSVELLMSIAWSPGSLWLRKRGWPPTLAALTRILIGVVAIALLVLLVCSSAR